MARNSHDINIRVGTRVLTSPYSSRSLCIPQIERFFIKFDAQKIICAFTFLKLLLGATRWQIELLIVRLGAPMNIQQRKLIDVIIDEVVVGRLPLDESLVILRGKSDFISEREGNHEVAVFELKHVVDTERIFSHIACNHYIFVFEYLRRP